MVGVCICGSLCIAHDGMSVHVAVLAVVFIDSFPSLPGRGIARRSALAAATMDEPSPVSGVGIVASLDGLVAEREAKRVRLPLSQELNPANPFQNSGWSGAEVAGASQPSSSFPSLAQGPPPADIQSLPPGNQGLSEPPPRRRLRVKTPSQPEGERDPYDDIPVPPEFHEHFITRGEWNKMTSKTQYNYVYGKIRGLYVNYVHGAMLASEEARTAWEAKTALEKQREGRSAFSKLVVADKNAMLRKWREIARPPAWLEASLEKRSMSMNGGSSRFGGLRTQGLLLTWNLPAESLSEATRIEQSLPPGLLTVDSLVAYLRTEPTAIRLWGRVIEHGKRCKTLAAADDVAVCLEVCPETYELQKKIRLHVHMFCKSSGPPLCVRHMSFFSFEGCQSHASGQIGGLATTKGRSSWGGFFYCCLKDKKGTVFTEATKAPFTKFLVNPAWIMSLVQASKLASGAARELLVRCVNASRHLKELELHEMELEKEAVREAMAEAERLLSTRLKKQKCYEQAQAFLDQFQEPMHRYKFLVLSGPSKVGKTAFARSLCEPGFEALEVNCASGDEPNLRAYRLRLHGVIIFDEIVAGQVASQRKLFQAQSAPVQLGCSATNCHSYDVFVWRKRLVLASNNWHSSLNTLCPADQDWIHANSIVMDVEEAMWEG